MNIEREQGVDNQEGVYEDDDIRTQLMEIEIQTESGAQGRQTKFSHEDDDDDDDGGVLIFRGRHSHIF
jgi:hypothetical protein